MVVEAEVGDAAARLESKWNTTSRPQLQVCRLQSRSSSARAPAPGPGRTGVETGSPGPAIRPWGRPIADWIKQIVESSDKYR
jgi:hypothetical protein